jgi:beta-glucosidase
LSYTSFSYNRAEIVSQNVFTSKDSIKLAVTITNNGQSAGDEVVQVYMKQPENIKDQPIKSLIAFERAHFRKGETKTILFNIPVSRLRHFDTETDDYSVAEGNYDILIGASSDDIRLKVIVTLTKAMNQN